MGAEVGRRCVYNGGDAEDFDNSYEETKDSLSKKLKKKKRHKKRK